MCVNRTLADGCRTRVGMTNEIPFQLLTTEELAEFLGVSMRTIEDWRCDRKGPPHVRLGPRTVRYRSDEVLAWLARGGTASAASDKDGGDHV